MPLPLIPIIIAAGASALGIGKGIKAAKDNSDAKDYNRWANNKIEEAKNSLEESRKASNTALETLGGKKLFVLKKSMSHFITSFESLKHVKLENSTGMDELDKYRLDKESIAELKKLSGYASSVLEGTAAGALGGALAGFGAYSAVAAFGTVIGSTTAIGGLTGAAATSATLAFLGGGSLAVGGLGMAGGMAVLGGIVAGPALAIMGFIVGSKASENLDKAKSNYAESKKIAEELQTAAVLCNGIRRRSYMFYRLLTRLDALFFPLVLNMETIIVNKGNDCKKFNKNEYEIVAAASTIAKVIKTILNTPILTEDGKLIKESDQVVDEIMLVIEAYKNV